MVWSGAHCSMMLVHDLSIIRDPPAPAQAGRYKNNPINSDNCTLNKMRGQRGEKCRGVTQAVWRRRRHGRQLAAPSNPLPHTVSQYHNSSLAAILQAATRRGEKARGRMVIVYYCKRDTNIAYSLFILIYDVM